MKKGHHKTLCIIQARMGSTRFPGKVLMKTGGKTLLEHELERVKLASTIDKVVVATTTEKADEEIVALCQKLGVDVFRGSEQDVLSRYYDCAQAYPAYETIVRITGDCPVIDPAVIDRVVAEFAKGGNDYVSNILEESYPDGMDVEVFSRGLLNWSHQLATKSSHREHVTLHMRENSKVKRQNVKSSKNHSHLRLTVDEKADFEVISFLLEHSSPTDNYLKLISLLEENPAIMARNMRITRNEGLLKSRREEARNKVAKSNALFPKVSNVIPLASQTFSKSYLQYIKGIAPLFADRAKGAYVWDVDGNKYLDMINGLLPVILGHQYPAVDSAIKNQLKKGIIFSLPSLLEFELAELLTQEIPCAEMVRFGKNGSDATSGAIRVARAVTGRDEVVVCGYHGWHDWYIGSTTRNLGVPSATQAMTHKFVYNDLASLEKVLNKRKGKVAAVIMEPVGYDEPKNNFLQKVKSLTHKHGALLIFDEVITGFRFNLGGAQKLYGVTPDLATFGKSMANGMPISALVGKRKYMKSVSDIFYSFTNGGEALSLAAAIATIKELKSKNVIEYIWKLGAHLQDSVNGLITKHGLSSVLEVKGKPCWQIFKIKSTSDATDLEIKSYIQQELLERGYLWYGQHNMSFSHTKKDIDRLIRTYEEIFPRLKALLDGHSLKDHLLGEPITNVFKIR